MLRITTSYRIGEGKWGLEVAKPLPTPTYPYYLNNCHSETQY